jgi:uncharacterized protein
MWVSSGTKKAKPESTFANTASACQKSFPVLDDPSAITIIDDESDPGEQRFITLGMGALGRLLVVVYTWRDDNIRIISARPAEAHEREEYEVER